MLPDLAAELVSPSGIRFPSRVWYEDLRTTVKLFVLAKSIVTLPDPSTTIYNAPAPSCVPEM